MKVSQKDRVVTYVHTIKPPPDRLLYCVKGAIKDTASSVSGERPRKTSLKSSSISIQYNPCFIVSTVSYSAGLKTLPPKFLLLRRTQKLSKWKKMLQ